MQYNRYQFGKFCTVFQIPFQKEIKLPFLLIPEAKSGAECCYLPSEWKELEHWEHITPEFYPIHGLSLLPGAILGASHNQR